MRRWPAVARASFTPPRLSLEPPKKHTLSVENRHSRPPVTADRSPLTTSLKPSEPSASLLSLKPGRTQRGEKHMSCQPWGLPRGTLSRARRSHLSWC